MIQTSRVFEVHFIPPLLDTCNPSLIFVVLPRYMSLVVEH